MTDDVAIVKATRNLELSLNTKEQYKSRKSDLLTSIYFKELS